MLVLMEVPTPGYPKFLRLWKDYARQAWSMLREGDFSGFSQAGAHLGVLRHMFRMRIVVLWRRLLIRAGLKRLVGPIEKLDHPHIQAGRSYRAKPLACEVVQIMAADDPHSTTILDDPRLGWREFTQGAFTVRRTPGRTAAMFKQPHVKELAAQLSTLLDSINTR